jgi:bifunctional DNA-binding transcriptional regulator/antitoxin component of YhaV-PrlF toxin-antitoxin module
MKLQRIETKRFSRVYVKYQVVVPNQVIAQAGWAPKDEIGFQLDRKGRIVMEPCQPKPKSKKLSYNQLKDNVQRILTSEHSGLTWSEIQKRVPALPSTPNALWVRRLEADIGLQRTLERKTYRRLWGIRSSGTLNGWVSTEGHR